MAYLQSDEISFLLIDYEKIETQPWFRNEIQKLCSITASLAASKMTKFLDREVSFDSRVFVIPPMEVCNYFIWRQRDWIRNSINMLARTYFSQKQITGLNSEMLKEKIKKEIGVAWEDYPTYIKHGTCIDKQEYGWKIDTEIPKFEDDRFYINKHVPEFNRDI